ncbi:MAG: hypothetical protein IJP77_06295 [Bacteroidales bacterium]|nr:hypothetical protein [Bacteroidales bacterium]
MKAKVIREPYRLANLNVGEVVEIIPGMETDAEGIWNIPAGKLVLCKKSDGTFCYSSLLDMEIVDETPSVDWQSFRREAAKDILAGMLSNPESIHISNKRLRTIEDFVDSAVMIADVLIRQLQEK